MEQVREIEFRENVDNRKHKDFSEVRATLYVPAFTLEGFPLLVIPPDPQYKEHLSYLSVSQQHFEAHPLA